MKLSDLEKKLIVLALDPSSSIGERQNASAALLNFFRKKYRDGYHLIKDLEGLPEPIVVEKVVHVREQSKEEIQRQTFGKTILHFGKYKGAMLNQVPADYLIWCLDNFTSLSESMRTAIETWLQMKRPKKKPEAEGGGFDFT